MAHHRITARLMACAAALALGGTPLAAQQAPEPNQQQQNAIVYLNLLISALQSENVEEPVKETLVSCIYGNTLRAITEAMDEAIAQAPPEYERDNPNHMLGMMAGVCGHEQRLAAEAGAGAGSAPASDSEAPVGR